MQKMNSLQQKYLIENNELINSVLDKRFEKTPEEQDKINLLKRYFLGTTHRTINPTLGKEKDFYDILIKFADQIKNTEKEIMNELTENPNRYIDGQKPTEENIRNELIKKFQNVPTENSEGITLENAGQVLDKDGNVILKGKLADILETAKHNFLKSNIKYSENLSSQNKENDEMIGISSEYFKNDQYGGFNPKKKNKTKKSKQNKRHITIRNKKAKRFLQKKK